MIEYGLLYHSYEFKTSLAFLEDYMNTEIHNWNQRCENYIGFSSDSHIHSISTLLDPWFKEVSFSASALDRAKKLLLTLMRWSRVNADEAHGSTDNPTYAISDSEDTQADSAEKKSLWNSFEEELKKKKLIISWLLNITKRA